MLRYILILLATCVSFSDAYDPDITDSDLYGPLLATNQHLTVSVLNRTKPSFAIYRPYNSSEYCALTVNIPSFNDTYVMQVVVPHGVNASSNVFFYLGIDVRDGSNNPTIIVKVTVTSMASCTYTASALTARNGTAQDYSVLGVNGQLQTALFLDSTGYTYMYDYSIPNFSSVNGTSALLPTGFVSYAIDMIDQKWAVIAGAVPSGGYYIPVLVLVTFNPTFVSWIANYVVRQVWRAPIEFLWQLKKARLVSDSDDFNTIYAMSLSINHNGDILFGVQSMNTVFHLKVNLVNPTAFTLKGSRIASTTVESIGFGKAVAWMDNTTAVILANNVSLDYAEWRSSKVEIYDLSGGKQLNNTQEPYSLFPTAIQSIYEKMTDRIIHMVASYAGSVTIMSSNGLVYIILPSPSEYYSATNLNNSRGTDVFYSAPMVCPSGFKKEGAGQGKDLFDTCSICPAGTYNPGLLNTTNACLPCDLTTDFCPFGSVAKVPLTITEKISQAVTFPKSPDLTGFEDILLLNMFNTKFEVNCLVTTPFFWTLIMIGCTAVFLIVMGLIKMTGKCEKSRVKIETAFQHFDIINGGERWIGGVLSLSILLIIIFAGVFTSSFLKQYPQATSQAPEFTCDETLRNSQFSSQMQSSGAAVPADAKRIFSLLEVQEFVLVVTLMNTLISGEIIGEITIGTITERLPLVIATQNDGCVTLSCNLTTNMATVNFYIFGAQAIGGVRIGLLGPENLENNNHVRDVNFSYAFSMPNETLSQEPYFIMELIQVVNETRSLAADSVSQFSGLWIPTFSQDTDRNFQTVAEYGKYRSHTNTTLRIDMAPAVYYIYNTEKPIIKTASVTFKNILFASMCMELFGFGFLFFKLAVAPLLRFIIQLISRKKGESKEANGNGDDDDDDSDEEKKPDSDDDDDDNNAEFDVAPQQIKLKPTARELY